MRRLCARRDLHCCRWLVISISILLFDFQSSSVNAFPLGPTRTRTRTSSTPLSSSLPTVVNPLTKRKITLGGPTYNALLLQGKWVQHDGTLQPLNLQSLRNYQATKELKGRTSTSPIISTPNNDLSTSTKADTTADEWHSITPKIVVSTEASTSKQVVVAKDQQEALQEQLIFVHKPSGLHCIPPRDVTQSSLAIMIQDAYGAIAKPCHRLDRDTSGVVLFGLSPESHADISRQFEGRKTSKTYLALVEGHPVEDDGVISLPIGKRKTKEGFNRWATLTGDTASDEDIIKPREAITKWRVQERLIVEGARFSMVELKPQTGRGHQLRLHMRAMGHPLLGDTLHAPDAVADCAPRLCLHAYRLEVDWEGLRLEATSVAPF